MDEQATPTVQAAADAQGTNSELMAMTRSSLGSEILRRYDAAVAMTRDQGVVAANDTRYIWASEAKAQCGIALGFLKSGTRNPVSIGKCDQAFEWMQRPPAPAPLPSLPQVSTVTPEVCRQPVAGTVFFDWNNAVPSPDAAQTISFIANNMQPCGWSRLTITGHADRSGSEQYNDGLSVRRANAVSGMLTRAGVNGAALVVSGQGESEPRVPTPDGVRNPQNRRVEITVK
jgi:outer membrane protein OmpA-like peptidoglycan-associated protein